MHRALCHNGKEREREREREESSEIRKNARQIGESAYRGNKVALPVFLHPTFLLHALFSVTKLPEGVPPPWTALNFIAATSWSSVACRPRKGRKKLYLFSPSTGYFKNIPNYNISSMTHKFIISATFPKEEGCNQRECLPRHICTLLYLRRTSESLNILKL